MPKKRMKLKYNKKFLFIIPLLVMLTVVFAVVMLRLWEEDGGAEKACKVDVDCVKQQVTCCPCSMGGRQECMSKSKAKEIQEQLGRECREDIICPAVYRCVEEAKCRCIEGKCMEKEK
jgi:hypothetical protein